MRNCNIFLKLLFFLFAFSAIGQEYTLSDFESIPVPTRDELIKATYSKGQWCIYKTADAIRIQKNTSHFRKGDSLPFSDKEVANKLKTGKPISAVKKVPSGYIIGTNKGEFGGDVWFLSNDGKSSYKIATATMVVHIFDFLGTIYVLEGSNHMRTSGSLLQLQKERNWKVERIYTLPSAPNIALVENDTVFIIASSHIISFNKVRELKTLLKSTFDWRIFYPSSAIVDGDTIYIAMFKGILKISSFQSDPQYKWLIKK